MTGSPDDSDVLPPHDIGSEQALLGAVLHSNDALDRARDHVQASDFFEPVHARIFETMCDRRDAGEPIDRQLMNAVLGNADLGGVTVGAYLARLYAEATTIVGAPGYARLIAQAAQMRLVLDTARHAVAEMTAGSVVKPAAYAAHMIEALDGVASAGLAEHARRVTLGNSVASVIARVEQARQGLAPSERLMACRASTPPRSAFDPASSSYSPVGPAWARRRRPCISD